MEKCDSVAVLMGGDSSEREISLKSGEAVLAALRSRGYSVFAVDIRDDFEKLIRGGYGSAFIALHGGCGEDGSVQGMLEVMGIPYTGSGVLASAATMDKAFAKGVLLSHGIKTPDFQVLTAPPGIEGGGVPEIEFPAIVKPSSEGSTIGVKRVEGKGDVAQAVEEAFRYGDKVLVERFIEGREVTVGVLDGDTLPIVEVSPKKGFYDFEAKYTKGMTDYIVPARIEDGMAARVSKTAEEVYKLFGCRGATRVDFIIGGDGPHVLEINTVPGMTRTSLLPMAAREAGLSFGDLVDRMLKGAALDSCRKKRSRGRYAA